MGNNFLLKTAIHTDLGRGQRAESEEENEMRGHVVYMTGGFNWHRIVSNG
jgi:hypothetical protein